MSESTRAVGRSGAWAAGLAAALLSAGAAMPLAGQTVLDEFTYDNLRLTAVQIDFGPIGAKDLNGTVAGGVRLDIGRLAPRARVLLGLSYYRTEFSTNARRRFEQRLRNFVIDPAGDDTIRVGRIRWSDIIGDLDLQYLVADGPAATLYLGLGVGVHVGNGSGPAINGTFVEDALDGVGASGNAMVGAEFKIGGLWRVTLDGRAVVSSEVSTGSVRAGVMYRFGDRR